MIWCRTLGTRARTLAGHLTRNIYTRQRTQQHIMSATTSKKRNTADSVIVKSLNDKRDYRYIELENGLRAVLISDLDPEEEASGDETTDSESSRSSSSSATDGEESRGGETSGEETDVEKPSTEKKSAAALCIGVGSFSDPDDIPGFAHFLEHMVFMGSEKYPKENDFDGFVNKHGGHTNAWTDSERTLFYFDVDQDYFRKSLDIFAQFFVSPLLQQDSVDRELEAVDSEFQERVPSDTARSSQILCSTAKPGHPMSRFSLGNLESLKTTPTEQNIDVYGRLRDFFNRYYSAQYMTLAIHSNHNLDTLEAWTRGRFSNIHNNKEAPVSFHELIEPFDTKEFRKIYKAIPVKKKHAVCLTWAFPALLHKYRVKPLDYLDMLINHEEEGSIYTYLKKRNWAYQILAGNSGEGNEMNTTWSMFDISVIMTDTGMEHVNEVIRAIFEYIYMMKKEGPQDWFFREKQQTEKNRFRWQEQGDPSECVEKVAESMQLYPTREFLTGHRLLHEYDHQLIQDCIEGLRVDNCNIMLMSSNYTDTECNQKEKWFGASYCAEDASQELKQYWTSAGENSEFFLPRPNEFISSDFRLKHERGALIDSIPQLISSDNHCKLYYKKDAKFSVPKGFVYYHLKSPVAFESVKSAALFDVFAAVLYQAISEPTYSALLAGYSIVCSCDSTHSGLYVSVNGFDNKLKEVLLVVMELLANFSCSEETFLAMKMEKKKGYHNAILQPSTVAKQVRWKMTERCYWSLLDRYHVIDDLTREEMMDVFHRFLKQLTIQGLVIGNFTRKEAVAINQKVLSKLPRQPNIDTTVFQNCLIELPTEKRYCQLNNFNPEGTMSCVTNYYQCGPGDMRKLCLNSLIVNHMCEPCFNTLRTKHQLGYTVGCTNFVTCGILALGVYVECKASKFSMSDIDEKIELFLVEFKELLDKMTDEEFDTLIEAEITSNKIDDTFLGEEASRHWREIVDETYMFNRHLNAIEILKTITKADLVNWFEDQYFGNNQKKMSIQIVGIQGKEDRTLPSDMDQQIRCQTDPELNNAQSVEDLMNFKNSRPYYPFTRITT